VFKAVKMSLKKLFSKSLDFETVTTKGGDRGESSLYSNERRPKNIIVFHVLGDLDELNSYLGIVRGLNLKKNFIEPIQKDILTISSLLATNPNSEIYKELTQIKPRDIRFLEGWQKSLMKKAYIPARFILPGEVGGEKAYTAHIDVCRTICRRCERGIVGIIRDDKRIDLSRSQVYLNRLSDLLFVLARFEDTV
jgi:cob(I)alamin adenosyltransferase